MTTSLDSRLVMNWLVGAGYEPVRYSGRAMYGKQCVAVAVARAETLAVGARLALAAVDGLAEENDADSSWDLCEAFAVVLEQVSALMLQARQDDLGLDAVVYWPVLEWPIGRRPVGEGGGS